MAGKETPLIDAMDLSWSSGSYSGSNAPRMGSFSTISSPRNSHDNTMYGHRVDPRDTINCIPHAEPALLVDDDVLLYTAGGARLYDNHPPSLDIRKGEHIYLYAASSESNIRISAVVENLCFVDSPYKSIESRRRIVYDRLVVENPPNMSEARLDKMLRALLIATGREITAEGKKIMVALEMTKGINKGTHRMQQSIASCAPLGVGAYREYAFAIEPLDQTELQGFEAVYSGLHKGADIMCPLDRYQVAARQIAREHYAHLPAPRNFRSKASRRNRSSRS
jgi:hypothetical protein